jgi:spermidine/putrescine-binding protein
MIRHWTLGLLAAWLAGCNLAPDDSHPQSNDHRPFAGQRLYVFNWSDYLDPALIDEFEQRTGATVVYNKYSSEAELEAKLVAGGAGYDVVVPSDRSLTPLIAKGLLQPLDATRLPHAAEIDPQFLHTPADPENRYSVPYFWGTLAVGVRTDHVVQDVDSFAPLFDERYRGRITLLDDAENVVAMAMLHLRRPLNSTEDFDLDAARELLLAQRPLVQAYTSDAFKEKLIKGESWLALGWSGDLLQAAAEEPAIKVVVPSSGTMLWLDSMAIPTTAQNARLAHAFIDFLLEPEIAARNAAHVRYATPNAGARRLLPQEMRADKAVYPSEECLRRCEWLRPRGPAIAKIEQVWRAVKN